MLANRPYWKFLDHAGPTRQDADRKMKMLKRKHPHVRFRVVKAKSFYGAPYVIQYKESEVELNRIRRMQR